MDGALNKYNLGHHVVNKLNSRRPTARRTGRSTQLFLMLVPTKSDETLQVEENAFSSDCRRASGSDLHSELRQEQLLLLFSSRSSAGPRWEPAPGPGLRAAACQSLPQNRHIHICLVTAVYTFYFS